MIPADLLSSVNGYGNFILSDFRLSLNLFLLLSNFYCSTTVYSMKNDETTLDNL